MPMNDYSRRKFTWAAGAFALKLTGLTGASMANGSRDPSGLTLEQGLQNALHDIGTPQAVLAAKNLARSAPRASNISIHLRSAGMSNDETALIAQALKSLSQIERARLHSFSLSYNEIGDGGALALSAALPDTLGELGLVDCFIGDDGGEAILNWAKTAVDLRMICIERNVLTQKMRERFMDLRKTSPKMAVYV